MKYCLILLSITICSRLFSECFHSKERGLFKKIFHISNAQKMKQWSKADLDMTSLKCMSTGCLNEKSVGTWQRLLQGSVCISTCHLLTKHNVLAFLSCYFLSNWRDVSNLNLEKKYSKNLKLQHMTVIWVLLLIFWVF